MKGSKNKMCESWNNLSYKRFQNRKNERELDFYEIENNNLSYIYQNYGSLDGYYNSHKEDYYGNYENLYENNTFSVEDLFEDKNCEME